MVRVRLTPAAASARLPVIELEAGDVKTLGRGAQADIVLDHPSLSRQHARLEVDAGGSLKVEDLDSTNGILLNGTRLPQARPSVGDHLHFGSVEYVVTPEWEQSGDRVVERDVTRVPLASETARAMDRLTLRGLLDTSRELMAFSDLPALLDRVLDRLQVILTPDRAAILLIDRATGALVPRAVRPHGAYTSVSQFASSTIVAEALDAREVLLVQDLATQPWRHEAASLVEADVRSAVCVPLLGRSGAIGALYADRTGFGRFEAGVADSAAAFAALAAAALETASLYEDRERHFRATLEAFARAIDARDAYTAGHSERVTAYTLALARASGLPEDQLDTIQRAGMLHDIGKVGVRDAVLLKPGPLDPGERAEMEAHVTLGHRMLEGLDFLADALPMVRGHHERWDGKVIRIDWRDRPFILTPGSWPSPTRTTP